MAPDVTELLGECDPTGALPQVVPLCRSANPQVSLEAIRCTLRAGDTAGIEPLLDHLRGRDGADAARAIVLAAAQLHQGAGTELNPDLVDNFSRILMLALKEG